jgi:hypothetical protein
MKHRVTLNWQGEIHTFWTTTDNERKAKYNAFNQLASKLGLTSYKVRQYFVGSENKITVEKEQQC